ncbi:hypothetical protein MUY14_19680 [Amycolatopsis sp. FBCC-B4732]|uniref:hypothetical protein n=1 Tax=Amycolatopsis sp. FBCC-B4732 TaxID=3079339 RepID=UPI001FF2F04D|nr:hypothetical protein [Amycolatopsis sp. FBCC-B4732]UOX92733.1 hypothetical protein MUY14_19680 [Amycolatopsis sp. FBCC-B4732]
MEVPEERSGSMVLRAWLEGGDPGALRVRVLSTIGTDEARPVAVTSREAVQAAVQNWLDELGADPMTFS